MAITVTNHDYDGILSRVVFNGVGDGSGDVTGVTTNNVIGQIVQIALAGSSDDDWTLTLTDTSNSMQLYTKTNSMSTDVTPNNVNSGSGAYCRGPLQCKCNSAKDNSNAYTVCVYYIKM